MGYFGRGRGPVLFDDVSCHGNESALLDCERDQPANDFCMHREDAGVRCSGKEQHKPVHCSAL